MINKFYKILIKYQREEIYASKDKEWAYFSNSFWGFKIPLDECIFDVDKFNTSKDVKSACFTVFENKELTHTNDLKIVKEDGPIKRHCFDGLDINEKFYKELLKTGQYTFMTCKNVLLVFEKGVHIITISGLRKEDENVKR